jgi:hypothetical protein
VRNVASLLAQALSEAHRIRGGSANGGREILVLENPGGLGSDAIHAGMYGRAAYRHGLFPDMHGRYIDGSYARASEEGGE